MAWHGRTSTGCSAKSGNRFAVKHLLGSRLLLARKHNPVGLAIAFTMVRGL